MAQTDGPNGWPKRMAQTDPERRRGFAWETDETPELCPTMPPAPASTTPSSPRVAFQGELGAYSEEAVLSVFPDAEMRPCATFEDAFEAVSTGAVDRAVLPIENALFGSVHINYDHLRAHDVRIIGELHLRIHHCLQVLPGVALEDVRAVRSHPQALGQCRRSLREITPKAETDAASDTARAAREVAETGRRDLAAIASRRAAERHGLEILAAGIEDNSQNYTRFLVLAPNDEASTDRSTSDPEEGNIPWKTSIVFALRENVPGALFKSLAVFALRDLDLYKIESRPLIGSPGRYLFYLDVHGAATTAPVRRALDNIREIATELQVLGSYPVAERGEGGRGGRV